MRNPTPLPAALGDAFSVAQARAAGIPRGRLRRGDLERPFAGVRTRPTRGAPDDADPFRRRAEAHLARAAACATRLGEDAFLSHETAVVVHGGPLPPWWADGREAEPDIHVSVFGTAPLPRVRGVTGHRAHPRTTTVHLVDGLRVASPASTWASMGALPLRDLVALGDYLCRARRAGVGRPDVGRPPLATVGQLRAAIAAGRRVGNPRLRLAVDLVREDAWSPRESHLRLCLVEAGLPEPELNIDVFDAAGRFLACVDLAYREARVAIEYHGYLHGAQYAADVERMAALRAAGWIVIEVTAALLARPDELARRVRAALRSRGVR